MKRWNPFEKIDIQWFADPPATPPPGTPPEPNPPAPAATPPPETELSADGTFLAQAPDKYKKDQKLLKDLLKHKNWGEVLDRMYASETELAEAKAKIAPAPQKPEEYQFDEMKFPEYLAGNQFKEHRENLEPYLKNLDEGLRELALQAGLSKGSAKMVSGFLREAVFNQFKAAQDAYTKEREDGLKAIKETWKGNFEANQELSRRAIFTFGKEKLLGALARRGLENEPAIIETFYEIGKAIGEGHLIPGKPGMAQPTEEEKRQSAAKKRYPRSPELTGGELAHAPAVDQAALDRLKKRFPKQAEGEKL